jgi:hypothetical protein
MLILEIAAGIVLGAIILALVPVVLEFIVELFREMAEGIAFGLSLIGRAIWFMLRPLVFLPTREGRRIQTNSTKPQGTAPRT